MPPCSGAAPAVQASDPGGKAEREPLQIIWGNVGTFAYAHLAALYGLYLACWARWPTLLLAYITLVLAGLGVTAGAHRLWAHRSYRARPPLQALLLLLNSLAFQNTAVTWVRDHRAHHKYSDTDGDPHNSARGFFFCHVGWLLVRKGREVRRRGREVDMTDIYDNPWLMFQYRYAIPFIGSICFVLPTLIPVFCWGETLNIAWHVTVLRYILSLHIAFLVNSAAHIWGNKPYDVTIQPRQNRLVSLLAYGEGFHNYHHVFPWDYKTAELGNNWLNLSTKFIDFFAWLGWAYDLRTVSDEMVRARAKRTGDGSDEWGRDISGDKAD